MTPLHHCIIDALTISEGRFKKPCPVLVLKMMLLNGEKSRFSEETLYTTNFTEPLSYQDSAFLKLPKFP